MSYCIDRTVDLTKVLSIFQHLDVGKEFDSKQFPSRKMEIKVEDNKILPPTSPFLSSPQLTLDIKDFKKRGGSGVLVVFILSLQPVFWNQSNLGKTS